MISNHYYNPTPEQQAQVKAAAQAVKDAVAKARAERRRTALVDFLLDFQRVFPPVPAVPPNPLQVR